MPIRHWSGSSIGRLHTLSRSCSWCANLYSRAFYLIYPSQRNTFQVLITALQMHYLDSRRIAFGSWHPWLFVNQRDFQRIYRGLAPLNHAGDHGVFGPFHLSCLWEGNFSFFCLLHLLLVYFAISGPPEGDGSHHKNYEHTISLFIVKLLDIVILASPLWPNGLLKVRNAYSLGG